MRLCQFGHLDDLDALDHRRLDEFLAHAAVLSAADMTNARTERAGHNDAPTAQLLAKFRRNRAALVGRLERLSEEEAAIRAVHPRLQQPVRLVDRAYFVAEHDDHHLAQARWLLRGGGAADSRILRSKHGPAAPLSSNVASLAPGTIRVRGSPGRLSLPYAQGKSDPRRAGQERVGRGAARS